MTYKGKMKFLGDAIAIKEAKEFIFRESLLGKDSICWGLLMPQPVDLFLANTPAAKESMLHYESYRLSGGSLSDYKKANPTANVLEGRIYKQRLKELGFTSQLEWNLAHLGTMEATIPAQWKEEDKALTFTLEDAIPTKAFQKLHEYFPEVGMIVKIASEEPGEEVYHFLYGSQIEETTIASGSSEAWRIYNEVYEKGDDYYDDQSA